MCRFDMCSNIIPWNNATHMCVCTQIKLSNLIKYYNNNFDIINCKFVYANENNLTTDQLFDRVD